nr:hypothetical protein [Pedobacter panaciterrae]
MSVIVPKKKTTKKEPFKYLEIDVVFVEILFVKIYEADEQLFAKKITMQQ